MKILLAEDTRDLNRAVNVLLTREGYEVVSAFDGAEALEYITSSGYDAIILDIMMPKLDGISLLKKIREQGVLSPVMLLTAKADIEDRVAGLDAGADDYLPKPFAMTELLARVRAMIRRNKDYSADVIKLSDLMLNGGDLSLTASNTVRLSIKEYELMRELMQNPGVSLTSEHFLEKVWQNEAGIGEDAIRLYISYLRNKLAAVNSSVKIEGSKSGYCLIL